MLCLPTVIVEMNDRKSAKLDIHVTAAFTYNYNYVLYS